jgi:hypothetical protein
MKSLIRLWAEGGREVMTQLLVWLMPRPDAAEKASIRWSRGDIGEGGGRDSKIIGKGVRGDVWELRGL